MSNTIFILLIANLFGKTDLQIDDQNDSPKLLSQMNDNQRAAGFTLLKIFPPSE
jgi:hypothetical protein